MNIQVQRELVQKQLLKDIRELINKARVAIETTTQIKLVDLYWNIGKTIDKEILGEERAEYGKQIVNDIAKVLTLEYGRGFTRDNIFRMIQFFKTFSDYGVVLRLSQELSWTHFVDILALKDPMKREFYSEMCFIESWSTRKLHEKIQGMLFERTALSKNTEAFIKQELEKTRKENKMMPHMVFKDPYLLDFLKLPPSYSENDLENAILDELSAFIQEMGNGFCFVERQKRITIGGEDFRIDLLFFHRELRQLICIELKLGKFSAAHKGQMELYLKWLNKYERKEGEGKPLGLILCSEKNHEQIELLEMGETGIHVAEYLTILPPKELFERRLHQAILTARTKFSNQEILFEESKEIE
jgi:predicted nuclease of restriction endonuclease-like (RecB) superfamily